VPCCNFVQFHSQGADGLNGLDGNDGKTGPPGQAGLQVIITSNCCNISKCATG